MSKLGITDHEIKHGLSPSDTAALANRLHSWLVIGFKLDPKTMTVPPVQCDKCKGIMPYIHPQNDSPIASTSQRLDDLVPLIGNIADELDAMEEGRKFRKKRGCSFSSSELFE